jgi:hypothetical protein
MFRGPTRGFAAAASTARAAVAKALRSSSGVHATSIIPVSPAAARAEAAAVLRGPGAIIGVGHFALGAHVLGRRLLSPAPLLLGAPLLGSGVPLRALATMASPAEALLVKRPATQVAFCVSSTDHIFLELKGADAQEVLSSNFFSLLTLLTASSRLDDSATTDTQLYVLRSVAGAEPTPAEERDVILLPPDTLLRDFVDNPVNCITPNNVGKVFVLVGPRDIQRRAFVPPSFTFL